MKAAGDLAQGSDPARHASITKAGEPDGAPRVASIDILRGLAILAILFMNINDMGGSMWAFFASDHRHLGWSQADQVAWWFREVLANGTARCMLEMLFGVGMVILTDRAAQAAAGRWTLLRRYYWRNVVLFAFGVIHLLVLLWPGDILHTYGIAALIAVWFRRLGPKWLLGIGLLMAVLQLGGGGYQYLTRPAQQARIAQLETQQARGVALAKADAKALKEALEAREKRAKRKAEEQRKIAAEDVARSAATGTLATWARAAWDFTYELQSQGLEIIFVLEALSTMLIGAALYKWGIIQGSRSRRFYLWMTVIAYAIGLGARASGAFTEMRFDDSRSIIWPLGEFSRLLTTLGHIGLVHLLLGTSLGTKLLRPFEAAGKTALSVYIAQTLICIWVLYPPQMFGLYGTQGWMALMITAFVVNAGLLWGANWWVRHYRIAPVEWAWRSIVEGRRLPFRKAAGPTTGGAVPVTA
jgi:uncharacterized protein